MTIYTGNHFEIRIDGKPITIDSVEDLQNAHATDQAAGMYVGPVEFTSTIEMDDAQVEQFRRWFLASKRLSRRHGRLRRKVETRRGRKAWW